MERKDVSIIMKRIKSHYQEFIVDDFKLEEWYKELKDYSLDDVMEKLDLHLKSEQYGNSIPKVYFLTKYLTKEKEKGKQLTGYLQCQICKKWINVEEYDKHYDRCSSIDYLNRQSIKYFDKEIDKGKYYYLSDEMFNEKYNKVAKYVLSHTKDNDEINYLSKYLDGIEKIQENLLD